VEYTTQESAVDFRQGYGGRDVRLATQFYLLPKFKMRGAISPRPQISLCHCAGLLKYGE